MSKYLDQFTYSFEKKPVHIYGSIVIGGTGAVGTVKGMGVASVTRSSTGLYYITLNDAWDQVLMFNAIWAGGTASTIGGVELTSALATIKTDIAASKKVSFSTFSSGSTLADPASGAILKFELVVRNSSVGPAD